MHRQTRETAIPKSVKVKVYERDGGRCVLCGRSNGIPNAHFIGRAHGGLGIEQNIVTMCVECHHRFDNTAERKQIREVLRKYLKERYCGWDEKKLVYKKYNDEGGRYNEWI